jgi:hypothetical protein
MAKGDLRTVRDVPYRCRSASCLLRDSAEGGPEVEARKCVHLFSIILPSREGPSWPPLNSACRGFVREAWCRVVSGGLRDCRQGGAKRLKGKGPRSSALTSMNPSWWRRRELNPRPEARRERPLHAQPLLGSRPAASRRGKTAEGQPRICFAAASEDPQRLHPHFATSAGARRVRYPANEAT